MHKQMHNQILPDLSHFQAAKLRSGALGLSSHLQLIEESRFNDVQHFTKSKYVNSFTSVSCKILRQYSQNFSKITNTRTWTVSNKIQPAAHNWIYRSMLRYISYFLLQYFVSAIDQRLLYPIILILTAQLYLIIGLSPSIKIFRLDSVRRLIFTPASRRMICQSILLG